MAHSANMLKTSLFSRRAALQLGAAAFLSPHLKVQAAIEGPILVELYTSQGCSSCPAADRLAAKLKARPELHVVSFNVDYWDYLGWHDTLAKPEYSKRQMDYAQSRRDNDVYTPQMIIDGHAHVVGSNEQAVENAIALARKAPPKIPVSLHASDMEMIVELGEGIEEAEATVWILATAHMVEVKIERGENAGNTIAYHNVVRQLLPAGMWNGKAKTIALPRKAIIGGDVKSCLAIVQKGKVGPVLGLAAWRANSA
jgi:hypothetical protein